MACTDATTQVCRIVQFIGYNNISPCSTAFACSQGGGEYGESQSGCQWPYVARLFPSVITTYYPAVPGSPGQPYVRPTEAQIIENNNEGWLNSCSSTIDQLEPGYAFTCTLSHDNHGAFIGLAIPVKELQPISLYEFGLMVTQEGISVFENGVEGERLDTSYLYTDTFRITRKLDGRIVYSYLSDEGTVTVESETTMPLTEEIEVYAVLYSAYDQILSASFEIDVVPVEPEILLEQQAEAYLGFGSEGAIFEQEAEATFQPFFAAVFEQEAEATCRMNYRGFGSIQATMAPMVAFITDYEEGEFDGIYTSMGGLRTKAFDDQYVPPRPDGIVGMMAPANAYGFFASIDNGIVEATMATAEAAIFDQENIGIISGSMGGLELKAYEAPAGYVTLVEDIAFRVEPNMLRDVIIELAASLAISEDIPTYFDAFLAIDENIGVGDDYDLIADRLLAIEEELGVLDQYAFEYDDLPDFPGGPAWVMNTDTGATTVFHGYDFNSFMEIDGVVYGVANNGIWKLQDTEQPAPEAMIDYGHLKLGTSQKKRIPYWYAAVAGDGKLILRLEVDGEFWHYEMRSTAWEDLDEHRFDAGKGLYSTFWNPVLIAPEGVKIEELESLRFAPIVLEREIQ